MTMTTAQLLSNRANVLGRLTSLFEKLRPMSAALATRIPTEAECAELTCELAELFSPEACMELIDLFKTLYNGASDAAADHRLTPYVVALADLIRRHALRDGTGAFRVGTLVTYAGRDGRIVAIDDRMVTVELSAHEHVRLAPEHARRVLAEKAINA